MLVQSVRVLGIMYSAFYSKSGAIVIGRCHKSQYLPAYIKGKFLKRILYVIELSDKNRYKSTNYAFKELFVTNFLYFSVFIKYSG